VRHPARAVAIAVGVVVVVLSVALATQVGGDPQAETRTTRLLDEPVPEFSVETLDGTFLRHSDLTGKVVIVNFWNTWCIPCIDELPALKEFYARHAGDQDFAMLGIVRDDTERAVRAYVGAQRIEWTIGLDPDSNAALAFGVRGQPETFAIAGDGTIVAFNYSEASLRDLETMLEGARRFRA
jgi:cytochrome c biogenesis protein CcmG/thiol:disulfide interchange protein DsbE